MKLKNFIRNEKRRAKIQDGVSQTASLLEAIIAAAESQDIAQLKTVVQNLPPAHRAIFEKHLEAELVAYQHAHRNGHGGPNAELEIMATALNSFCDVLANKCQFVGARFLKQQEIWGGAI